MTQPGQGDSFSCGEIARLVDNEVKPSQAHIQHRRRQDAGCSSGVAELTSHLLEGFKIDTDMLSPFLKVFVHLFPLVVVQDCWSSHVAVISPYKSPGKKVTPAARTIVWYGGDYIFLFKERTKKKWCWTHFVLESFVLFGAGC
jgi:hypothetical protein